MQKIWRWEVYLDKQRRWLHMIRKPMELYNDENNFPESRGQCEVDLVWKVENSSGIILCWEITLIRITRTSQDHKKYLFRERLLFQPKIKFYTKFHRNWKWFFSPPPERSQRNSTYNSLHITLFKHRIFIWGHLTFSPKNTWIKCR